MAYAELLSQSNFSFLRGASHPQELAIQAAQLGYSALALTDECSVAGVVRAHQAIKDHDLDLKLIVGSRLRFQHLELALLCPDRRAYAELCRVITNARRRADKGSYQLAEWDLKSLRHCLLLWLPQGTKADQEWGEWLVKHHHLRLWIGYQRHLRSDDSQYLAHCQHLARSLDIKLCACGGVLMHSPERLPLQHVLSAVYYKSTVKDLGRRQLMNEEYALRPIGKLQQIFSAELITEAERIAELCQFSLEELRYQYPDEVVPQGMTPIAYLRELVAQGKTRRFPEGVPSEIQATIDKELELIEQQGYAYFFLTIYDVVQFAQRQQILYQGRGSAANSIVCYCLEITSVDPRQISVLFERFISKERDEPPDIDVDFEHERREEVIQYIYSKYGRERAALAASVRTYRLRSALREVGKALGFATTQLSYFVENINRRDRGLPWQQQITQLGLNAHSAQAKQFIALVEQIIGFPRHLSQHVGGYVISAGPLYELVPVENAAMEQRTVIQWDKDDLESLGLLKVDVLALGMLTAIRKSFALIEQHYQRRLSIAQLTAMQDDPDVYRMLQHADTIGVFQIESRAQMSMLPRLKPRTYYDLVIQIAIVRPGPIQGDMVHPYLKRRNGEEPVTYPSEAVEQVLSRTLGVPIFQEQVIKLAMVAAGFTGGEADQLRRAMASWKKSGELQKFRLKLIDGMEQRGYQRDFAERIYQQICGFGEYGFPESHSASFAVLAYASAWLKYHYPAAFFCGLLNSLPMGFYSASQLLQDAKRHGVAVLPACVNHSHWDHTLLLKGQEPAIRLGLRVVKGFSQAGFESLQALRPSEGFSDIAQLRRSSALAADLPALASANALACLSGNRYQTRWQLMQPEELPLLAGASEPALAVPNFSLSQQQQMLEDYAATGVSLEHHPISLLAPQLGRFCRHRQLLTMPHKSLVTVVGLVVGRQAPGTAGGVTFITLEDDTGNINVVVWAATSRAQQRAFLRAKILKVTGVLEREGEVIHVIAGRLSDCSDMLEILATRSRDFH